MTVENRLSAPKRRTRAEVQRLVAEFVSSGMRRSEFCRSRGLSFGTLDRHLKKRRWRRKSLYHPSQFATPQTTFPLHECQRHACITEVIPDSCLLSGWNRPRQLEDPGLHVLH